MALKDSNFKFCKFRNREVIKTKDIRSDKRNKKLETICAFI